MAGYVGQPIAPAEIVSAPPHSLYVQSYRPREMQSGVVNADGYGAALWLDDGVAEPAVYRTPQPIWADPNQHWIHSRLRARALLAAVRSATPGIGYELANVQPFAHGRVAFLHNGFITGFRNGPQRALRESVGNEAYEAISGSSDSECIFALVVDELATRTLPEAVGAAVRRLERVCTQLDRTAVATLLVCDGERLVGCRWSRGFAPATLYAAAFPSAVEGAGFCLASEPLDGQAWRAIPPGGLAIAGPEGLVLEEQA